MVDSALKRLQEKCPQLLIDQREKTLATYSRDESYATKGQVLAVFFPTCTEEVSYILRAAFESSIPVVPRGAGSGLSGGAVPLTPSWVVSLEKMNRILNIDESNHQVVTEPGVITAHLRQAVEKVGLFYPPIPSSLDYCTIGGNVATNAGGLCAVKYGVTRKYVLGLEAVLMNGDVIHTGGKFVKHTSGYDLTQLIVGSEGTLAIITKIIFALLPLPTERSTLLVPFSSCEKAAEGIGELLSQGVVPPTLELMPKEAIDCVLNMNGDLTFPFRDAAATLLIEMDAFSKESLATDTERLYEIVSRHMAAEPIVAETSMQREAFWSVRKKIREAIAREGGFVEADAVVPRQALPKLILAAEHTAKVFNVGVISYGHAGDGNLHTYFQKNTLTQDVWNQTQPKVLEHFFAQVVALEGTISGEHGIGHLKKDYLSAAFSKEELKLMQNIKHAFDPKKLLNSGKII